MWGDMGSPFARFKPAIACPPGDGRDEFYFEFQP